jgi:hypothetical protein
MFDKEYTSYSLHKEESYNQFIKSLRLINEDTKTRVKPSDYAKELKDKYLWLVFTTDEQTRLYSDRVGFFITLTLDSKFHDVSTRADKTEYFNSRAEAIEEGYKALKTSFRDLYNGFFVNRTRVDVKYSRVVEPHKDKTPHLHAIVFIEEGFADEFTAHFSSVCEKNKDIGKQVQLERLKDVKKASGYIAKYVRKSLQSRQYDGWIKYHKIRSFQSSRDSLPKWIFKIISGRVLVDDELMAASSYLFALRESSDILVSDYDEDGRMIRVSQRGNSGGLNKVRITRTVTESATTFSFYKERVANPKLPFDRGYIIRRSNNGTAREGVKTFYKRVENWTIETPVAHFSKASIISEEDFIKKYNLKTTSGKIKQLEFDFDELVKEDLSFPKFDYEEPVKEELSFGERPVLSFDVKNSVILEKTAHLTSEYCDKLCIHPVFGQGIVSASYLNSGTHKLEIEFDDKFRTICANFVEILF